MSVCYKQWIRLSRACFFQFLIILSLVFYSYPSHGDLIDTIKSLGNKIGFCIDSLAPPEAYYLPFNKPLSTPIYLHQRVLFPLDEGGFSYGEVMDLTENEVQLDFKEIYQEIAPSLTTSYSSIDPVEEPLFFMREREGVSSRWISKELLRRTLQQGDFIKYNKRLLGEIAHGIILEVSEGKSLISIRQVGSENKPLNIAMSIMESFAVRLYQPTMITPREIIEVIDMDQDEYWQTHMSSSSL